MTVDTPTYTALIGLGSSAFGAVGIGLTWLASRQTRIATETRAAADMVVSTQARVTALEAIAEANYKDRERLSAENLTLHAKMQELENKCESLGSKLDSTLHALEESENKRATEAKAAQCQREELTKRIAELMAKLAEGEKRNGIAA